MTSFIIPAVFFSGLTLIVLLSLSGRVPWGLYFLVPLFPLQNVVERFHQFPLGKDFADIILISMIIGWVISAQGTRKLFSPSPFNKLLAFMFIFTFFALWKGSAFLSLPPPINPMDVRVQTWKNYMILPLLFFLTYNSIRTKKQVINMALIMAFSMLLTNWYTIRQISWSSGLASRLKLHGTFVWLGPNEVAAFYAIYSFVLLGLFMFDKVKMRKIFYGVTGFFNAYSVMFLFSRGAYVAVLAGLAFFSLLRKRWLLIPLIALVMFWQTVLPVEVVERVNQTETEYGELDSSNQKRLIMWEQSMNLFWTNALIGAGYNIFPFMGYELGDTHNIYIKVMAEQGLVGISLFLSILFLALWRGWQLHKKTEDPFFRGLGIGFSAAVISLMVANFFGDRWTYLQVGTFFWVFLGLVERANRLVEEEAVSQLSLGISKRDGTSIGNGKP